MSRGGRNGLAVFSALFTGISEQFLERKGLGTQIPVLNKFLQEALDTKSIPNATNECIDKHNAKDGSLGVKIKELFTSRMSAETSTDSSFHLYMSNMEKKSIPPEEPIKVFLESCIFAFAKDCNNIADTFKRTPTLLSGDIEYGVAFVTTAVTGSTYYTQSDAFHVGASADISDTGDIIELTSNAGIDNSKKVCAIGSGVVGLVVHFMLLVKTRHHPTPRIKESFPVRNSRDKKLQYVLGSMATRMRRKIVGPRPAPMEGRIMAEGYDSSGNYQEDIATLSALADNQAYAVMNMEVEVTHTASLRILGGSDSAGQNPPGQYGGRFDRGNNVLYHSTFADLEAICKGIHDNGSVSIGGEIVDGIKPVINCNFEQSLPVVYDSKLSGGFDDGSVPGWVLRSELKGELIMLWKVSGVEQSSDILTAYENNQNDWHVRECREYLDAGNKAQIEKLESKGFFRLDPAEADPEEVEIARLESGSLVMMGRQYLALKLFRGDEADYMATTSAPGSSVAASLPTEAPETLEAATVPTASLEQRILPAASNVRTEAATVPAPSFEQIILPVVSNVRTDQTPPRKKSKNEGDSS